MTMQDSKKQRIFRTTSSSSVTSAVLYCPALVRGVSASRVVHVISAVKTDDLRALTLGPS
jgi:hypothetical protein